MNNIADVALGLIFIVVVVIGHPSSGKTAASIFVAGLGREVAVKIIW
jgi:hypothetical protein